jgi:hypothetical protein
LGVDFPVLAKGNSSTLLLTCEISYWCPRNEFKKCCSDLKRDTKKDTGPKDVFEMASGSGFTAP